MSAQLRNIDKQLEDKEFVKNYFRGVETGQDVTKRLVKDGVTYSAPDLIARLVGWLEEAEPSDESTADARARAEQEIAAMNLPSKEEEKATKEETKTSSGQDSASTSGGQSSDGTTRTSSSTTSSSKPSAFGSSKSEGK